MEYRESETVELKSIYSDDIKKEVIAMANSLGGTIYVGVDDDGGIVGVENADETIQRVSNAVRNSIKPDVTILFLPESTEGISEGQTTALMQDMAHDHASDTRYSGCEEIDQN